MSNLEELLEEAKQLVEKLKDQKLLNDNQLNVDPNHGNIRYFKLVYNDNYVGGRFSGQKPKQAASKALSTILKQGVPSPVVFSIIECTRGAKHKVYKYVGERIKLETPMKVTIGIGPDAREIEYNYTNKVKKQQDDNTRAY